MYLKRDFVSWLYYISFKCKLRWLLHSTCWWYSSIWIYMLNCVLLGLKSLIYCLLMYIFQPISISCAYCCHNWSVSLCYVVTFSNFYSNFYLLIPGKSVPKKDVTDITQRFNIQINNLTQVSRCNRCILYSSCFPGFLSFSMIVSGMVLLGSLKYMYQLHV